jgi:rhomboid protease GluP
MDRRFAANYKSMGLPPRFWFKWQRVKSALRAAFGGQEQSYETAHRMCPHCRGLIDRSAGVCPLCGASVKSPRARTGTTPGRVLGGLIPVPSTATSALVSVNIALYGISWYLTQASAAPGSPAGDTGTDAVVMVRLGAMFGRLVFAGEWWRLVTAIFLHAGLLHIAMNLWCLFDLGPTVESLFSTTKFIVFYLVTGVVGFVASLYWNRGLSVGASGAILGLIGVLIGASYHHGHLGKDYRSQLFRWVFYILLIGVVGGVFGFGTDNAAHVGGLVTGAVLGYVIPEGEPVTRAEDNLWNALALMAILIIAGSFALMALQLNRPIG